jgi:hypothetical protein
MGDPNSTSCEVTVIPGRTLHDFGANSAVHCYLFFPHTCNILCYPVSPFTHDQECAPHLTHRLGRIRTQLQNHQRSFFVSTRETPLPHNSSLRTLDKPRQHRPHSQRLCPARCRACVPLIARSLLPPYIKAGVTGVARRW